MPAENVLLFSDISTELRVLQQENLKCTIADSGQHRFDLMCMRVCFSSIYIHVCVVGFFMSLCWFNLSKQVTIALFEPSDIFRVIETGETQAIHSLGSGSIFKGF